MGKVEELSAKLAQLKQEEVEAKRRQIEKLQKEIAELETSDVIDAPEAEVVQDEVSQSQPTPKPDNQGIPIKFVLMIGMTQDNQLFWDIKGPTNIAELAGIVEYANRVVDRLWQQVELDKSQSQPAQPVQEGAAG